MKVDFAHLAVSYDSFFSDLEGLYSNGLLCVKKKPKAKVGAKRPAEGSREISKRTYTDFHNYTT